MTGLKYSSTLLWIIIKSPYISTNQYRITRDKPMNSVDKSIIPSINSNVAICVVLVCVLSIGLVGCARQDSCLLLTQQIEEKLPTHLGDTCLNDQDWKELQKTELPQGLTKCNLIGADGKLNRDSVNSAFNLEPCKQLSYKIYLEASGSMKHYDDPSIVKGLRANVREFYTRIDEESPAFSAWVSDRVYADSPAIHAVLTGKPNLPLYGNPSVKLRDSNGNEIPAGQTDFSTIFTSVLNGLNDNDIALVVSDMVYSERGRSEPLKLALNAGESMRQIFKDISSEYEVLVVQFSGDYNGPYYSFKGRLDNTHTGKRPYYFILLGKKGAVMELITHKKYITEWGTYPDNPYRNRFLFKAFNDTVAEYCYLSQSSGCKGRALDESIEGLTKRNPENNSIYVAVDFRDVYADDSSFAEVSNYDLAENKEFELQRVFTSKEFKDEIGVGAIEQAKWDEFAPTHVLKLGMNVQSPSPRSKLNIKLKQRFPDWATKSSTLDDSNINAADFSTTTFAFKEMMEGLYKAYYKSSEPTIKSITIKFTD